MTPKLKSYLLGGAVGLVVFAAVAAFPFAPLEVAAAAGVVIGVASVLLIRSMLDKDFLLDPPRERDDDGSGERPVWSSIDVDSLSPFGAWANGDSILPHGDDTQEMRRPDLDQTQVTDADFLYRYLARHGAGERR